MRLKLWYNWVLIPAIRPAVLVQCNHCRSRKSIRDHVDHISIRYIAYFLEAVTLSYFASTTPNRDEKEEQLCSFLLYNPETFMSSVVAVKRHSFFTRRKKRLTKKLAQNGSILPILMIQTPFDRPWIALQHTIERTFSVEPFSFYASSSLVKKQAC